MTDSSSSDLAAQRPSRQTLVVPPRQSSWPVAVGAVASAAAGFGLVLFLGIGRVRPARDDGSVAVVAAEPAATAVPEGPTAPPGADLPRGVATTEPDLLPPPDATSAATRFAAGPGDDPVVEATAYAAHRRGHDEASLTAIAAAQPRSRFSSPDLPAAGPPDTVAATEPSAGGDGPPTQPSPVVEGPADLLAADPPATEPLAPAPTSEPPAEPVAMSLDPTPDASAASSPTAPPGNVAPPAEVTAPTDDVFHPGSESPPVESRSEPATDGLAASPTDVSAPPAHLPIGEPGRALEPAPPPVAAATPAGLPHATVSPFAAAPPLGPGRTAAPVAAAAAGLAGQGVPGPIQLEGVQAPQLAVEKRGPKEIQVGKPARYEVIVRNVGSATAHEVLLRDAVPKGTSLIATTPPASPAEGPVASTDLVWALGVLPPGGEARVLMELMPESEGEVGSVASVSFRADATLRARATKPQLTIDCVQPQPVRIGGDVQVTITVSNPGSGDATGVVLEAFLPETVSHRAGRELEFDVGRLRPGDTKTIDLVLGTSGAGSQPAQFIARADGGIEVDRPVPIPVTAPTLDVSIDMPARRFLQRPATCSIAMLNAGTASARSVELAAQLPAGVKFVRANNAGWHDERTHRVLWNLEELPAGETGVVEVVVMPVQAGEQRIAAAARSADGPSDQAVHVCQVEGLAALAFQVGDSEDPIEVQGVAEYVVRVANEGTKAASGVRLAATLVGDLEPIDADGPGRHRIENLAVEFEPLAKLGPGEEVVYRIRARGRRSGHQRVQVQLASEDTPTPITKEEVTSFYDDR